MVTVNEVVDEANESTGEEKKIGMSTEDGSSAKERDMPARASEGGGETTISARVGQENGVVTAAQLVPRPSICCSCRFS